MDSHMNHSENNTKSRRDFIKTAAVTAVTTVIGSQILNPKEASSMSCTNGKQNYQVLKKNAVVLFQGDSITDAGRSRESTGANNSRGLGTGYPLLAASELLAECPDKNLSLYNRGISGNKVFQLADRWQTECLDIKPDILSILVGVNDFWHMVKHGYEGTLEIYEQDFRKLIKQTLNVLPHVKLIIGEPYALAEGSAVDSEWFPAFDGYRAAAKKIANEFDAAFIPYQSIYKEASKNVPATYWSADGVHPSTAGAYLMAQAWLETLRKL